MRRFGIRKEPVFLCLLLAAAGIIRFAYCWDMAVTGDETVSLVQASGQAVASVDQFPDTPGPVSGINCLIEYSDDFGVGDVIESMRKAGMHPPFYYIFLHFILKYFGTGLLALRLPSVIFAALSIGALYAISRELFPKLSAWPAVLLLAFSPYGIHYAHMIRPYPLVMLLSLLSTWLALRLDRTGHFNARHAGFWGYVLLSVIGLYTLYHYVFVFAFQLIFLLGGSWRDKGRLAAVLTAGLISVVAYLPWLPAFRDQLRLVTSDTFYYFGKSSPPAVYRYFLEFNFTQALPGGITWYKIALAILITGTIGAGVLWSLRTNRGRYFAAAAAGYFVLAFLADKLMKMQTLNISKLLFFVVPLIFLYLGAGLCLLIRRHRTAGIIALFITGGLLLFGSSVLVQHPLQEDSPRDVPAYRSYIRQTNQSPRTTLVVINETARRSAFTLTHSMRSDSFDFLATDDFPERLQTVDLADYRDVYILSPRSSRIFEPQETERLGEILPAKGFELQNASALPTELDQTRLRHYTRR